MDMAAFVQLRVFILLVRGLSPRFLTEDAAEALEGEAELLLTLQCRLEDLPSPKPRDLKEAAAGLLETEDLDSRIRDWERQRH